MYTCVQSLHTASTRPADGLDIGVATVIALYVCTEADKDTHIDKMSA